MLSQLRRRQYCVVTTGGPLQNGLSGADSAVSFAETDHHVRKPGRMVEKTAARTSAQRVYHFTRHLTVFFQSA